MPPASLMWSALTSGVKVVISVCSSPIQARSSSRPHLPTRGLAQEVLQSKLAQLHVQARHVLIGLEATSRDAREPVPVSGRPGLPGMEARIPGKPISLREPRGLRAKTDQLDATTIARVLRSCEARRGYVPTEVIATSARISPPAYAPLRCASRATQTRSRPGESVLFPEFSQIFADPCRATALALLTRYRSRARAHVGGS
jgi:hypothetical protein